MNTDGIKAARRKGGIVKRDMELIREILLAVETDGKARGVVELNIPNHDHDTVSYHVRLLHEAGLLSAIDASDRSGLKWLPRSLTWSGHEFLDAARNDTVWQKTMTKLKDQAASVPFEVLKAVVIQTCKEFFGVA